MTIKENLQKAQQQQFLKKLKELEDNNKKLINNNNLLIKTLKDQDLELLNLETIQKETEEDLDFLETTLIDLVASLMKNCDQLSNLLPKPKENSKKKPNKNKKLELKKLKLKEDPSLEEDIESIKRTMSFLIKYYQETTKKEGAK